MSFCAAILILKVEEKQEHFLHYLPYYFKKDKNATEMQKKICMEKVLWLIKQKWFGKFHAGDSSLEIYPFTVGVEVDCNQIEALIEAILCHKGESQYSQKYPNQVMKIICTSLVMLTALMFGFHIR